MGKKDARTKSFLKNDVRFADVCNFYLYGGREVIRPGNLKEMDTSQIISTAYGKKQITVQRVRDLLKEAVVKESDKAVYLLIGIENQSDVHYAMAVKNMLYDSINYSAQVEDTARRKSTERKLASSGEFLSGFGKEDKLVPVITITIFWGAGSWDGPRTLHEMLGTKDAEVLKYISDYKVNLIVPEEIEDFGLFKTDIGYTLNCIKHSGSKKGLLKYMDDNKELFTKLDEEVADVISECTGIRVSDKNREGGKVNMCKAAVELWEDGVEKGLEKGLEQGIERGRIEIAITLLVDGTKPEDVSRITKLPLEKVEELKKESNKQLNKKQINN